MFWNSTVLGQAYKVEDGHLDTIVGDGWTQLDLLFDGAFKCALSLNFDKELPINFAADGTLDFTCMSKLPECWSGVSCPITPINGSCPFAACPNWPNGGWLLEGDSTYDDEKFQTSLNSSRGRIEVNFK